jgi:HEPN domain-containing protein
VTLNGEQVARRWLEMAERDWVTVGRMFASGDYHWGLFIGHLVVEKLLKALYSLHRGEEAPRIHDLARLAERTGLGASERQVDLMDAITRYNIGVRYPDSQQEFYRLCAKPFAEDALHGIEEIRSWLLELIAKSLTSPGNTSKP